MKIINYVVGKDNKSKIFFDIFTRFSNYLSLNYKNEYYLVVSELPIENAHVYHYHRPQFNGINRHPSVVTVHHDLEDTDLSLDKDIFINEYQKSDKVICLNSNQKAYLERNNIVNTKVIPHGYDRRLDIVKKESVNGSKLTIGFISKRYGRRVKGEVYLIDLFKRLDPNYVDFIFVGAGRREEASIARSYGYDVKCYEYLPYSTLLTVYKKIDYLLMCSDSEGGPANIPEALGSRTPVLAFNIGLVTDLVLEGKNGFILSQDPNEDARLINRLSKNKEITSDLLENWYVPESLYSWEKVFEEHLSCYEEVMSKIDKVSENENKTSRIEFPLKNIKLEYNLPKVIKKNDFITVNVSLINEERFLSLDEVNNSNMYIAIKYHNNDTGCDELFRQRISNSLNIGHNSIKFSFILNSIIGDSVLSIDLLCDHLGWFSVNPEPDSIFLV